MPARPLTQWVCFVCFHGLRDHNVNDLPEEDHIDEATLYKDFNASLVGTPWGESTSGPSSLLDVEDGKTAPLVSPSPAPDVTTHGGTSHESAAAPKSKP